MNLRELADAECRIGTSAYRDDNKFVARWRYQNALRAFPDHVEALNNLSGLLAESGCLMAAAAAAQRAYTLWPTNPYYVANLGNVLTKMDHHEAAIECFRRAIGVKPDEPGFHHSLGIAHWPTDMAEAEGHLVRALRLTKEGGDTQRRVAYDLALTRLAQRKWEAGFAGLFAHREGSHEGPWEIDTPVWNGEPLAGKRLLVWANQGLGDIIQFSRFLPELRPDQGDCLITFAVPGPLVRFIEWLGVSGPVIDMNEVPFVGGTHAYDYQAQITDALRFVDVGGALEAPFDPLLDVPPWCSPRGVDLRIGVCWAGNPKYQNDRCRSMPFEDVLSIADLPGVRLQSLQFGDRGEDIERHGAAGLVDPLPATVHDVLSLASVVDACDLVVTVDTSVLHVAGTIRKRALGLLAYNGCWRWGRGVDRSPFYPELELVRQPRPGDWVSCMQEVRRRVSELLEPEGSPME